MFAIRRRAAASSMTGGRLSAHRVEHSRITLPNCVRYRARLNSALSFDSIRHKQAFAKAPRTQFTQSDGYDRGTVQRLSRNRASLQGYPEHGPKKTTGSAPNSYVDVGSVDPNVLRLNIGCIDLTEVSIQIRRNPNGNGFITVRNRPPRHCEYQKVEYVCAPAHVGVILMQRN